MARLYTMLLFALLVLMVPEQSPRCQQPPDAPGLFRLPLRQSAADFDVGVKAYKRGDYVTALLIFRQLAEQGNALAQTYLGFMYDTGRGVPQDYEVAVRWYHKAAEQGYAWAQYKLGLLHQYGRGVPQDYVQAHMWFNLAAEQGEKKTKKYRDLLAEKMILAQIAEAQRLAREWNPKRQ